MLLSAYSSTTPAIFGLSFSKCHREAAIFHQQFLPSSPTIASMTVLRRTMAPQKKVASCLGHDFHFLLRVLSHDCLSQISGVATNDKCWKTMSRNAKSVQFVFAMFTNLLCKCSACYSRCWVTQAHVRFFIECSCMPACVHACLRLCSSGCKRKNRNAHINTGIIAPMRDAILCGMKQSAVIFCSCVATWSCLHFQVLFIMSIPAFATCCSMPNDDEGWSWLDASFALRSSFYVKFPVHALHLVSIACIFTLVI